MIQFKCEICGRRIEAADKDAGEQEKCPQCNTMLVVPNAQYITMRERVQLKIEPNDHAGNKEQLKSPEESPDSDDLAKALEEANEDDRPTDKRGFTSLYFDEGSLFVISFSLLALFAVDGNMRRDLHVFITRLCGGNTIAAFLGVLLILLPFFTGLGLCLFHAFSKKEKTFVEKAMMLFFAVAVSAGTGIYTGWYIWTGEHNFWLLVFAAWNIIYSCVLVVKFEAIVFADELDSEYISDFDASVSEVLFGAVAAAIIISCGRYWLKLHWVIIYSICITFASASGRIGRRIFGLR
jgi:DNA-directed RNA polymerase subunit RPC12/RpoP